MRIRRSCHFLLIVNSVNEFANVHVFPADYEPSVAIGLRVRGHHHQRVPRLQNSSNGRVSQIGIHQRNWHDSYEDRRGRQFTPSIIRTFGQTVQEERRSKCGQSTRMKRGRVYRWLGMKVSSASTTSTDGRSNTDVNSVFICSSCQVEAIRSPKDHY